MSDFEIERRCAFEKKHGIVQLSATHLVWTPNSAADGRELRLPFLAISQFQVSKEGSAKRAMIRLTSSDRPKKITLDFDSRFTDRDAIRDVLNRLQSAPTTAPAPVQLHPKEKLPAKQREWRAKLLGRKEVRQMHKRLVLTKAVSENSFWEGMRYRYTPKGDARSSNEIGEDVEVQTHTGVPSHAFTASPSCDDLRWDSVPNSAQRHQIFLAYPAVKCAFIERKAALDDENMWALFAASSMAPRATKLRSKRDTMRAGEADAFFAPYQAKEGEVLNRQKEESVRKLDTALALDRFDDHRTSHIDDPHPSKRLRVTETMRLMQMVNSHGGMIVGDGWKETDKRPLESLFETAEPNFAPLTVRQSSKKHSSTFISSGIALAFADALTHWKADVCRFSETVDGSGMVLERLLRSMQP